MEYPRRHFAVCGRIMQRASTLPVEDGVEQLARNDPSADSIPLGET
jgi:hypothetical protein